MTPKQFNDCVLAAKKYESIEEYVSAMLNGVLTGDADGRQTEELQQIWLAMHRSIRDILTDTGLTAYRLSQICGITETRISNWVTNNNQPKPSTSLLIQQTVGLLNIEIASDIAINNKPKGKMTAKQYYNCVIRVDNYDDVDTYVSDLSQAQMWGDDEEIIKIELLREIYTAATRPMREIIENMGYRRRDFAYRFVLPIRTVENWTYNSRKCPLGDKLMIQRVLGILSIEVNVK